MYAIVWLVSMASMQGTGFETSRHGLQSSHHALVPGLAASLHIQPFRKTGSAWSIIDDSGGAVLRVAAPRWHTERILRRSWWELQSCLFMSREAMSKRPHFEPMPSKYNTLNGNAGGVLPQLFGGTESSPTVHGISSRET